jgi:hypothetical protein
MVPADTKPRLLAYLYMTREPDHVQSGTLRESTRRTT